MMNFLIKSKQDYFITLLFVFFYIFSIFKVFDHSISRDAWQYGEWLINYQNGFVRRGLIGEFIFNLSKIFKNNIQISYILVLSIILSFFYYFSYNLIQRIKFNFLTYFIIFSPLFYFFIIVISKVGIRKEIVLFVFYLFYLTFLSNKSFNFEKNWKVILIFPFLLFNHEGAFFYLPYIFLPLLFLAKKKNLKIIFLQFCFVFLLSFAIELSLYFNKGTGDHTVAICESLSVYAPDKCDWWGPIAGLKTDISLVKGGSYFEGLSDLNIQKSIKSFFIFNQPFTYIGFIFYIVYSFLPIYVFFNYFKLKNLKLLSYYLFFTFLFSIPLFYVSEDWSRWFSIHFYLIAFNIFFLINNNLIILHKNTNFSNINSILLKKKFKTYFFILLFFYATSLHHHHFFFEDVKLEFTYLKIYKKLMNNN